MKHLFLSLCLSVSVFLLSCSSRPDNPTLVSQLPAIYPDYIGVTIPADIAPLNFNFSDEAIDRMDVIVKGDKGGELHVNGEWALSDGCQTDCFAEEVTLLSWLGFGGRAAIG